MKVALLALFTVLSLALAWNIIFDRKPSETDKWTVIDTKNGRVITFEEMADQLMNHGVIGVSESHDNELHHRVQLEVIKAVHARDESLAVGMEMFQRPFQDAVDRYLAGELTEAEFLAETEYLTRWGYPYDLYKPIVDYTHANGIPLGALNASKELTARVKQVGFDGLTDDEKAELGPIDFHVKEHRDFWFSLLGHLHGNRTPTEEEKEKSYQIMTIWDDYMAQSAARFMDDRKADRIVVLAGSGHIDGGFGIPDRAGNYSGKSSVTIATNVGCTPENMPYLPVDYIVCVPLNQAPPAQK